MSSHHVVREKQEPALLIAGLNTFPDELLGQLLEWSPTVIVTKQTAELVQTLGIKIDWLIADEAIDLIQSDIKHIPAKNSPIVTALEVLIAEGYPAVNIITDELDLAVLSSFANDIDLIVFYQQKKIITVRNGFNKWLPTSNRLEFLTLPHNFLYTGLSAVADSVYQTTHDGLFTLSFDNDFVWLAEAL